MTDAYEALPYAGRAYARTHPDRLGLVGALHGIDTVDPASARVLEIGCAAGDNLLPIAVQYPGATCVGVDLAQVHVDRARQAIDALGLDNATVHPGSVADLDASDGPYDYVIAHGVWSWVSPELQERLFAVCRDLLAPGGVAYVSYNALPGQHVDQWLRTVMKHHVRGLPPAEAVEQARAFLGLVGNSLDHRGDLLEAGLFRAAAAEARTLHDAFFFHDYLGDEHHPARVADFVARARAHGLDYLGDADSELYSITIRLDITRVSGSETLTFTTTVNPRNNGNLNGPI